MATTKGNQTCDYSEFSESSFDSSDFHSTGTPIYNAPKRTKQRINHNATFTIENIKNLGQASKAEKLDFMYSWLKHVKETAEEVSSDDDVFSEEEMEVDEQQEEQLDWDAFSRHEEDDEWIDPELYPPYPEEEEEESHDIVDDMQNLTVADPTFIMYDGDKKLTVKMVGVKSEKLFPLPLSAEEIFEVFNDYFLYSPFFKKLFTTYRQQHGDGMLSQQISRYLQRSRMERGTAQFWSDWTFDTRRHRDDLVKYMESTVVKAEALQQDSVQVEESTTFSDQRETTQEQGYITSQVETSAQDSTMQEQQWHVRNIMSKPIVAKTVQWNTSDAANKIITSLQVPGDMILGPHYNQVATFAYWRGHPRIRVQLNGTKFHSGRLIAAYIPQYSIAQYSDVIWDITALTSFPHVILDASISNSGILDIPFVHMSTYFNSFKDGGFSYLGQFMVAVFNRLGSTTTASQTLDVTIWISYDNCELHQPCHAHTPTFSRATKALAESGIEGLLKSVAPVITDLVAPGASLAVGNVLGGFSNLDKPADPVEISRWVPNTVTSLNFGDGLDKSNRLSLRPGTATITDADIISTTKDDMNLLELAKIPTRLSKTSWGTSNGPGTELLKLAIYPTSVVHVQTDDTAADKIEIFTPTLLAYISRPMKYWRGSLRYKVQIIASAMQSGRIQIAYTPGYAATDFSQANYANTYIVDLQEKSEVEFVVPYMATRPWMRCDKFYSSVSPNSALIGLTSTGELKIHVLNRLSCPDSGTQSVDINVFISAGDDFELAFPSDLSFFYGIGKVIGKPAPAKAESLHTQETVTTRTDESNDTLTAGGGLISQNVTSTLSENAMDLKTVLRRYQVVYTDYKVGIPSSAERAVFAFQNSPCLSGVHKRYGDLETGVQCRTHLCHYSELFTFWRGSLRYKFVFTTNKPISFTVFHVPGVFGPVKFEPQATSKQFSEMIPALSSVGVQIATSEIQNSIEFEIPFYTPYQQLRTIAGGSPNATTDTGTVFIVTEGHSAPTISYTLYQAAGDDFGLNYLRGAPKVQIKDKMEGNRTIIDNAQFLYGDLTGRPGAAPTAEMWSAFRNLRNPYTQTLNTAAAVEKLCNTSDNIINSLSASIGLAARTGTTDIGEEGESDEDEPDGGLVQKLLSALGSFANELVRKAGMKIKEIAVTIANLVSGFNSFLQASSPVVKICAIVTVVSELFGAVLTTAKDTLFWIVSKFMDWRKEGNQRPSAESSTAIISFAPVVMATAAVGMLLGGFAKIPNDKETNDVMKLVTERMRTFNFGCSAMSNIKGCYNQMKELFDWIQETCLNWLAPQLLAQMKLQREFSDVEQWTRFIDETMVTDYVDRSNWDTEFRSRVGRAADAAERYNRYLINGRIGKEASVIREYVRKCYEMRDLVDNSFKALPSRKDPFCVCVSGVPGVGKSGSILYLADRILDDQGYPQAKRICPVNPIAKQFSESYSGHAAIYMDDLSAFTSEEQYHHFFNLKANTQYQLDKPFDKTDYFRSDFIFMTTNIPYPKPNFIADIDAFNRRRDCLIKMEFKDQETADAARAGVPGTLTRDYEHARFRFLDPRNETTPEGPPLRWAEMEEEVKRRARLHYIAQEKQVRYLLKNAGYAVPPLVAELPEDGATVEEQIEWFENTFKRDAVAESDDGAVAWWTKNFKEVEFDMEQIRRHYIFSLYSETLFPYLDWSENTFCLTDEGADDEVVVREAAGLKEHYIRMAENEAAGIARMNRELAQVTKFKALTGAKEQLKTKLKGLKDGLKKYWEEAKEWLEKNCPVLSIMQTWPAKLALGLAGIAVLVGFGKRIVHRCLCAVATHLGYRCPKCGKWPQLENCKWKDWLLKEWKEVYGETVDYEAGRILTTSEEQALAELHSRPFTGLAVGTEAKMAAEGGPYSDITSGGKQIRIMAQHGPYNNETHGAGRARVFANSGQKTDDLITNRIIPCLYRLRGSSRGVPSELNGFALGGRTLVIPSHFYDVMDEKFEIYYNREWMVVLKDDTKARRIPNKDLVLFTMPVSFHEHKSIAKHLISERQLGLLQKTEALLFKQMSKDYVMAERVAAKSFKELHYELEGDETHHYYVMGLWEYRSESAPGACGSILMTTDERVEGQILGFHCAGNGTYGYSQILTREMVTPYMTTQLGTPTPECLRQFGRVVPPGHFGRVGQLPKGRGVRQSAKTEIIETKIHGMISAPVSQPAILETRDPRYKGTEDIMSKGIGKYGKPAVPFEPRHIQMVEESLNAEIEQWEAPREARVLTMEETLQGVEILDGFDRLPMNTSPGWPYTLSRPRTELGKAYLFDAEQKKITDKELEQQWNARLTMAKLGERVQSVWTCCLKDERRPLAKIEAGSTRLFVIPPVDFSLLMRMYTLDFSVAIKNNRHDSFTKVGIDPQSFEWTKLYNFLAQCSEYVVAGDFERFDGALPPELTHQFFKHCNHYYTLHGSCSEEDMRVRGVLADESVHTVMLARDEIFVTHVGNKSGNPNTVNINSFANYYYMAISFLGLAEKFCPEYATMDKFRKSVKIAIYGDDNVLAIKREILEWYNQLTIAAFLKEYGIIYTNETKTGLTKYKKLDDASFLKCRFANHESIAKVKVPHMSEATILELLNWTRKAPDQEELLESNCNDALRFAYFYGAKYYNGLRTKIVRALKEVNLSMDIMTYNDFHYWFLFVCGMLPHARSTPEMNVLETVAASGNSGFARFMNRAIVGVPCKILSSLGWFVRSSEKERTDPRFAIAIPSGEGKTWLCSKYPHLFVDHDDILLPAAKQALKTHGMSWSRLWEILDVDMPVNDKRILLVHHPANTRRQMIGSYLLPQPSYIRANAYQRMRLGKEAKTMERDERNTEIMTLARTTAPYLFKGDEHEN